MWDQTSCFLCFTLKVGGYAQNTSQVGSLTGTYSTLRGEAGMARVLFEGTPFQVKGNSKNPHTHTSFIIAFNAFMIALILFGEGGSRDPRS